MAKKSYDKLTEKRKRFLSSLPTDQLKIRRKIKEYKKLIKRKKWMLSFRIKMLNVNIDNMSSKEKRSLIHAIDIDHAMIKESQKEIAYLKTKLVVVPRNILRDDFIGIQMSGDCYCGRWIKNSFLEKYCSNCGTKLRWERL